MRFLVGLFFIVSCMTSVASGLRADTDVYNNKDQMKTECQVEAGGFQDDLSIIDELSEESDSFAGRGCCSWHQGVCGCSAGRAVCCDGSYSPSCGC